MKASKIGGAVLAVALAIVAIPAMAADVEYKYPVPSGTAWSKPGSGKVFQHADTAPSKTEAGNVSTYPAPSGTGWSKRSNTKFGTAGRTAEPACGPVSGKTNRPGYRGC